MTEKPRRQNPHNHRFDEDLLCEWCRIPYGEHMGQPCSPEREAEVEQATRRREARSRRRENAWRYKYASA